jgi:hypothetical protein
MDRGRAAVTWRRATPADATVVRDLEREANLPYPVELELSLPESRHGR